MDTAELPHGWRSRLITWDMRSSDPANPRFVEPHDLVASKLVAGREKDFVFAAALIDARLVELDTLAERAKNLPSSSARVLKWLEAYRRG
ncbi:hypothetical protein B8W67_16840 [Mycolicibacillus koreensis]|uniref:Uncharacterized protein n=1 Tax=Mycolicibacillus koreensis TaxID=1069220 RepID=A0AA91PC03_9MYCO|nr:hypothetical protein B8W67_16840 [Mycolicibacillus koreensis]